MTVVTGPRARFFAAAVAASAAAGLVIQFLAELERSGTYAETAWVLLRYFTILTNALVCVVLGRVAIDPGRVRPAWLLAGTVFSIMLVGIVYGLLLRDMVGPSSGDRIANVLLHMVTPILAPLYWLAFARKGGLRYRDILIWAAFPAVYFVYALVRGAAAGSYAYPFLDVGKIGWAQTAVNCGAIGLGFLVAGCGFVWLDHALARRRP